MKRTIIFVVFLLALSACSKEGHIDIKLDNVHLEDTPAGFWLSAFNLDYSPSAKRIKKQIIDKLHNDGYLIEEFNHEENGNTVYTSVWNYAEYTIKEQYYKGGIWKGPKIIPYQEYSLGGWNVWITIELGKGIPYSKLLPHHYMEINPNRKYEHTATIESMIDQGRRLFLFGYGSTCHRISLY